jgi:hypothetical protein
VRSNGQPSSTLPAGTTQTTLSVSTNEAATCRYTTTAGTTYAAMANTFGTTGGVSHSTSVSGLSNGASYTYYVRCQDTSGNSNTNDFSISFAVAAATPAIHVGNLSGVGVKVGGPNWTAQVTVPVVDHNGAPVAGATVNAAWTNGYSGGATCTTSASGTCALSTPNLHNRVSSVTLTVNSLSHPTLPYNPAANASTSIVVAKP